MGITPLDNEIAFSRIVNATVGQILEIPFNRSGWVYLGEIASRRGIVFNSRRNDPQGQSFIFTLEAPGTYILRFYRQDFINDFILNDHVQVNVADVEEGGAGWFRPPVERGRVVADPRWPTPLQEAQLRGGARLDTPVQVTQLPGQQADVAALPSAPQVTLPMEVPGNEPPVVPPAEIIPPEVILRRAQDAFDRGNVAAAIESLNQFREIFPSGTDELFWMYGQFYEAASPSRNILLSLNYYRRLVNEFPQSHRAVEARSRIAHIERFFINIQ